MPLLLDSGRAVRANLSLDAGLLDAIDKAAKAHGLTRSAFLASVAREKIEGCTGSREMTIDGPRCAHRAVAMPINDVARARASVRRPQSAWCRRRQRAEDHAAAVGTVADALAIMAIGLTIGCSASAFWLT